MSATDQPALNDVPLEARKRASKNPAFFCDLVLNLSNRTARIWRLTLPSFRLVNYFGCDTIRR
jgi:hypothetical protein